MRHALDETHDPALASWVVSANRPGNDFPLQNLPFGVFRKRGDARARVGVAIGDSIADLALCRGVGLLEGMPAEVAASCAASSLDPLMALGRESWQALRRRVSELLRAGSPARTELLVSMADAVLELPCRIGDYTDFYASIFHATNVGRLFRPDNPLLPNYKYLPIAYHGRASSVVPSGTDVRRPRGQTLAERARKPSFGPSKVLDYELEAGFFVGPGNRLGEPIPIEEAEDHIFGFCLVNDWSARDIQKWEYQPLGPFLAKSFATTISPWVVTLEALAPFRAPAFPREAPDPAPLPHLDSPENRRLGGIGIGLEVLLSTVEMRRRGTPPARLARSDFGQMYWTPAQMLAHHASNGCNLRPGDLIASGTVSGATPDSVGSLLELTAQRKAPIELPGGETRRFLEDGDEVILRGRCEHPGFASIGFGECRGRIAPAPE